MRELNLDLVMMVNAHNDQKREENRMRAKAESYINTCREKETRRKERKSKIAQYFLMILVVLMMGYFVGIAGNMEMMDEMNMSVEEQMENTPEFLKGILF